MHFWDTRTLETFNWLCLFDIFKIEERSDYLFVNVPLWFILCLLMIQAIYSLLQQLDQRILFILALLCILFKDILLNFPSPFMINNALYWINFYIMGHLFGKKFSAFYKIAKNDFISQEPFSLSMPYLSFLSLKSTPTFRLICSIMHTYIQ